MLKLLSSAYFSYPELQVCELLLSSQIIRNCRLPQMKEMCTRTKRLCFENFNKCNIDFKITWAFLMQQLVFQCITLSKWWVVALGGGEENTKIIHGSQVTEKKLSIEWTKNSCKLKILRPLPHQFSNGPPLTHDCFHSGYAWENLLGVG